MVLFDRSWYNRAGVEKVMGFCTEQEYVDFLRAVPTFERLLVRSGTILLKYWFSVSPDVQFERLRARLHTPVKRWKLSPMDIQSLNYWHDYSKVKDRMLTYCSPKECPWFDVASDVKKHARLNCISHLLSSIPYDKNMVPEPIEFPETREIKGSYVRIPTSEIPFVPDFVS
jgi:polyphosphate kinase 2 (PPK2 family)